MMNKIALCLSLIFGVLTCSYAQSHLEDWSYDKNAVKQRKVIPHRYTGESHVKYHKRVHRVLDVREKKNRVMHWPRNPYYKIITDAAYKGSNADGGITTYTSDSLDYGSSYEVEELKNRGSYEFVTQTVGAFGDLEDTVINVQFKPEDIKKYRIMEDWIFDFKYSDFRAKIIAIAPLFELKASTGVSLGEDALFWAKYEDLRPIHVNQEVFNPFNDAARLSFDDWFEMRQFSSYIVKESNMWDLDIKYQEAFLDDPMAALLESEKIKNDLFIFEHDLWEY